MNDIQEYRASLSTVGTLAVAGFTAFMATGQPTWPGRESPTYEVDKHGASYSHFVRNELKVAPSALGQDFAFEITEIFAALSEGQGPLGVEFEAAIFDDLDSLYES